MYETLLMFWGKTPSRSTDAPEQFHPAIYHMLDVAVVAEALLADGVSPRLRYVFTHTWAGTALDGLIAWLPFLIATHDLGKISAAFQGQAKDRRTQAQRARLEHVGITFPPARSNAPYHAEISALWLDHHLRQREPGVARRLIEVVRDAMGGHHGRFAQTTMRDIQRRLTASERNAPQWQTWRDEAYTLLRTILAPSVDLSAIGTPQRIRPATAALTGFIILCDWVGSNSDYFPAAPDVTLDAYPDQARRQAVDAIQKAGLVSRRAAPTYTTFTDLRFDIPTPRPLQQAIDDLPDDVLRGPLLAIIEAPTGEGKTEAALALARRLGAREHLDELFFALPTMATSNQMFLRLSRFYDQLYGAAVRLTHSQAMVSEQELQRAALAGDHDAVDLQAASARAAIEWFTGPKKAMLAPFGVGTVDQVEFAGLNVRHYMLRLFALAGKVVIIDEVHAYDTYMSVILEHTLAWLASMGTSVLLLSATLPTTRHRALAASYVRGLAPAAPLPEEASDLGYPMLSLYHADGQSRVMPEAFRRDQRLTVRLQRKQDAHQDARHVLDLVRDGGAVARICNRVDDAQAIYAELHALQVSTDQRFLLHARFPLAERQQREQALAEQVGIDTTRTADQSLIIVGTQVLEQSLDYDVDVMVSDFAPIDLLLQRAGRLHRHLRERAGKRPPRHMRPVLEVVLPLNDDELPNWKRWERIYDSYILWRTWEVLREEMHDNEREIVLPRDYRACIEAVYQDEPVVRPDTSYAAEMRRALRTMHHEQGAMRSQAQQPLTPRVDLVDAIVETADRHFIEDENGARADWQVAKTRLGDRITVVLLYRVDEKLALDAYGTHQLSADLPPRSTEELRSILSRSVPISDPRIIAAFRSDDRPDEMQWPWPESEMPPLLRSLFPLVLDAHHTAVIDNRVLRLDAELGLVIEKENV